MDRYFIWTLPKQMILVLICVSNLCVILRARRSESTSNTRPSIHWVIFLFLWLAFFGWYGLSIWTNDFHIVSFSGLASMGSGAVFYFLMAVFSLSNAYALRCRPDIFQGQIRGILAGCIALALSIFPQAINWRIDYTVTSGRELAPTILVSGIHRIQTPIGFFSHRGYAAFVLAFGCVLNMVVMAGKREKIPAHALYNLLISTALFFTKTRGPIIAAIAGIVLVFCRVARDADRRRVFLVYGVSIFLCGFLIQRAMQMVPTFHFRKMPAIENVNEFTSSRSRLWKLGIKAILRKPVLGWAGEGFGTAFPYVADWQGTEAYYFPETTGFKSVLRYYKNNIFEYIDSQNNRTYGYLPTYRAHNIAIDLAVLTGIPGMLMYFSIVGFCLWLLYKKGMMTGIGALGLVYLVFCITWFEATQYSYLGWWALSSGVGAVKETNDWTDEI